MTDRQNMGCVYEEPTAAPRRSFVLRWGAGHAKSGLPSLPWRDRAGKPVTPSACPLYLGRLAEDSDVHFALPHFRRGTLAAWLGEVPSAPLLDALEAHEAGVNDWVNDPDRPKAMA